ncbi:tetratricopeptide repeat-containing diguanylate cyclase [Thalassotalea agarivorans]|nr:tetratricopeptide repeat-containing diguanylate cyclase [Thalassotalea agarivorans]
MAQMEPDFILSQDEINRSPLISYRATLAYEKNLPTYSNTVQLMWWLQKADIERLLYYDDLIPVSLDYANGLVDEYAPLSSVAKIDYLNATVALRQGNYQLALGFFQAAIEKAQRIGDNALFIRAKGDYSYTLSQTDAYSNSITHLKEAYLIAFANNDLGLIAELYEIYGSIYSYIEDNEKAEEYYLKALERYEKLGYQVQRADALYGLATIYRDWGKPQRAIDKYNLYLEQVQVFENPRQDFFGYYGLGTTHQIVGDCTAALKVIQQALNYPGAGDFKAELYKSRALCLVKQGNYQQAKDAHKNATVLIEKYPELIGTTWHISLFYIEAQIANGEGNHERAYTLMHRYHQQHKQLIEKRNSEKLSQQRMSLEASLRQQEKSLMPSVEEINALNAARQQDNKSLRYSVYVLATILFAILLIAFVMQLRANRKMRKLSITDELSGLFNRRYTFEYLRSLLDEPENEKHNFAIAMFDIDNFKQLNDAFGHPFGDYVIRQIAKIAQSQLRKGDVFGRIGGEEFMCVLPRTDKKQALFITERILEKIRTQKFVAKNKEHMPIKVTMSAGIASINATNRQNNGLYLQADQALYEAKKAGKDCIVCAQDKTDET